ncbi:hypothetical protein Pla52o_57280 [Novipirellula galeiformis]|uniref:Uncharacterized protein n=1 Tax=Novipirellula galeiformis TaxID=2528004 RepID=A0A5C6BIS0_9BACT|nr:hypothetical protein [Novipirellula galeiformis]TWU10354.1 hypothetical protein Pla52o_57280 [Novipirellula galeiformis]
MQWIGIISLSIACCVVYGILHDQVTARICVEYFTIGHPPVFSTQDPTLLGIGWGVIATWWVGAILGVPLAMVSRLGTAPRKSTAQLFRPMLMLMMLSASFATVMGTVGFIAAWNGWVFLVDELATRVPPEKHVAFITDLWAHSASYFAGFVGGIILMVHTWRSRRLNTTPTKAEPSVGHEVAGNAF